MSLALVRKMNAKLTPMTLAPPIQALGDDYLGGEDGDDLVLAGDGSDSVGLMNGERTNAANNSMWRMVA